MSRIGRKPIIIPEGVTVKNKDGIFKVAGPKGDLKIHLRPEIKVEVKENQVLVKRQKDDKLSRALHGLSRALIANMIEGVTAGFTRVLKLVGTGYRVAKEGENLNLSVGFSHPVIVEPLAGIKFEVEGNETIKISGIDKALVGQMAAKIRSIRPPEPYKGKGIRYQGEEVKLKPGKAGKAGTAGFGGEG